MTPDGIAVTKRVHAAVLVCVKTAAILGAVLALGPLKEEDYMRLVRMALLPKDEQVGRAGCQHSWPCYGKPAIIFHDRGKIFTSERARQVLVDRLGIITEQAPPYAPSAKGTVENLFRWMTQRFERRLPNTSYGIHDAKVSAETGDMTLEELERCFIQAVVDDYQQAWDELRRQRRAVLWEQAAAQSGVPQYLGYPDDLKLLLMKAQNRKRPGQGYQVADTNRLSFHGRWYVCPGLLSRLKGREFEVYFDRRDISVLYLFVDGIYVGEAYCPQLMGDASANGRPVPCGNTMRSRRNSRVSKGERSARVFRTKQCMRGNVVAPRFVQTSKHVNGIANEKRSTPPKSLSA